MRGQTKGRRKKKTKLNTSLFGELCIEPMVRICSASVMCRSIRVSTTVLWFRVSELGFEPRSGLKDGPDLFRRRTVSFYEDFHNINVI